MLDELRVSLINSNLTVGTNLTRARRLKENLGISFEGAAPQAPFDIPANLAAQMLRSPNPHGRANSDVVRPVANAADLVRQGRGMWTIDFGSMDAHQAALYEVPFEYVKRLVRPIRELNRRQSYAKRWWNYGEVRTGMRRALLGKSRYFATPHVSKHRIFVWVPTETLCNSLTIVFARDDDYFFGVLHSRAHEVWALLMGTQLESRPRYTPTTCFETFPFPRPSSDQEQAIAEAAREMDALRQEWLNPPESEIGPSELKKRTLTNLYNERPTWLVNAHRKLDEAVFAAYGWPERPEELPDSEIVSRLLRLNLEREPA
jgi:hypothetical protein